jgi:hypothetical protein
MGMRLPNPGLVKLHYSYRIDEIARLCGVSRATVRSWLEQGLPTIDSRRPMMVRGINLREFLARRRRDAKIKCPPGHFYCLKCRSSRRPAEGMADYIAQEHGAGNLAGICPVCERWMYRRVGTAQLGAWLTLLDVTIRRPG